MAEDVQAVLDAMVPGLKDLQERQVFTADEIHQIVDRRRNSEYDIRRLQDPRKADFLSYIKAEVDLEQLRRLRMKKLRREQAAQAAASAKAKETGDPTANPSLAKSIGDFHILNHIHYLWKRMLWKFGKTDVSLYLQYAEYCKEINAHASLSRVWAEAIQLHPHEPRLWIEAACHEYYALGSIQNARVLLQRGIRVLQQQQSTRQQRQQELWWQLFSLELHFVERLQARQEILKGKMTTKSQESGQDDSPENGKTSKAIKNISDQEGTGPTEDDDHGEKSNNNNNSNEDGNLNSITIAKDPFRIARVVYRNAVAAIPNDVAFRLKFWDQCRVYAESTESLQRDIVQSIREDLCKDNPEAWMAWALYQWEQKQKTLKDEKQQHHPQESSDEEEEGEQGGEQGADEDDDDDDEASPRTKSADGDREKRKGHGILMIEPSQKKRRMSGSAISVQDEAMSVLDVLRQATLTLATNEMYLKAVRMITRYIASLQEEADEDDDDDEDPDIGAGMDLLETLFKEAEQSDFFSSELVMEQALLLSRLDRKEEAAQCLQRFADARPTEDALKVWLYLAELTENGPVAILQTALNKTDIHHPTYYELLLHLFGAKLQMRDQDDNCLLALFEKISLLTPGFLPMQEVEEPIFGVRHALDASLQLLRYLNETHNIVQARKVYRNVLVESSLGSIFVSSSDDQSLMDLIDEAAKVEKLWLMDSSGTKDAKTNRKHLIRLYDEAAKLFGSNTQVGRKYLEKKREEMLGTETRYNQNPEFLVRYQDIDASSAVRTAFQKFQLVHLSGPCTSRSDQRSLSSEKQKVTIGWKDLGSLFESLNDEDKSSWCVETPGSGPGVQDGRIVSPKDFLSPKEFENRRGYCSFLVQKDKAAMTQVLERVPATDPHPGIQWHYPSSGAIWFFFGRNHSGNLTLQGRPEHTDSISSDGTWHYQLSGSKIWILRPTSQLLKHLRRHGVKEWNEDTRLSVHCVEGDILCINTRLWFHRTIIPCQDSPSVSYARDFFIKEKFEDTSTNPEGKGMMMTMMNLDGLYATDVIAPGTMIFTEDDIPGCEMHRSTTNANCQVVELEDTNAVVSVRTIAPGEFFCVAESEDDHSDK